MVMRKPRYAVLVALIAFVGGFAALVVMRDRPDGAVLEAGPKKPETEAAVATKSGKKEPAAAAETNGTKSPEAMTPPPLDRPVRIVGLGWDLMVPGALATMPDSSGKATAFSSRRLEAEFRAADDLSAIKEALTRGGAADGGADIAIVPLPEMVAAFEDLRALEPRVFFLVGWSRGREGLYGRGADLLKLPRNGRVKLIGEKGSAATLTSLFALDASGVAPERVALVAASDAKAAFAAVDRGESDSEPDGARVLLTTADAGNLVPFVAIAPKGFLKNERAMRAWVAAWQEGVAMLQADVPAGARRIATLDGAPKTVDLVRRLGLIEFADLAENARRFGLAGRDAVTLDELFVLTWRLWREASVLVTPAPQTAPLATETITSLIIETPSKSDSVVSSRSDFEARSILRVAVGRPNDAKSVHRLGLIAGVFSRSAFRVGAAGKKKATEDLVVGLSDRFGLDRERFRAKPRLAKRKTAVLEVLAAP